VTNWVRNIRYAVRVLARTPAFTATVVATLAIVIGANTAVFSLIDAVLLEPLPFPEPDRLVLLSESRNEAAISNTAPVRLEEWNAANTTLDAITGYYTEDASETSSDLPEKFRLARVAPRFTDVWGVAPVLGRGFIPTDSQEGAAPVALVSHRYWTEYLDSDPRVLERQVRLTDAPYSIVGVMPATFRFPDRDVDIFVPRTFLPFMTQRTLLWYSAYGRLKPGVTVEEARADLATIQARLADQFPETDRNVGVHMEPFKDSVVGAVSGSLWIVFGAVSVLVLIAATNVAALLLARAARRNQEIAVRLSLGASRSSVLAQSLTETAVLAAAGAALGLALAAALAVGLRAWVADLPRIEELAFGGGGILLYTAAAVAAVTALCGVLPALRATQVSAASGLSGGGRRTQVSGRHALQWLFVGVQVMLAVVLLAGSGLLIRSLVELSRVEPGFDASRVLSFKLSGTYQDFDALAPRIGQILDELAALPGVEASAISAPVPGVLDDGSGFQFGTREWERLEGAADDGQQLLSDFRIVSPSYYAAMQIPVTAGELCALPVEGGVPEIMVNNAFAARYSPATPVVGRTLYGGANNTYRIAGVVGNAREYGLGRAATPTVYPCRTAYVNPASTFLLRTSGEPASVTAAVRAKLKELTPLRAVHDVAPLAQRMGNEYSGDRLRTTALALFAGVALSLATLGVYGTLSYVASLRRREVGLRVALGALRGRIVAEFLGTALRVVAVACLAGLVLFFALSRLLAGLLYGVSSSDPLTLGVVIALVTAVGAMAALVPALRAARVDPMTVLREE
jgi:putative ABC transport system permease protein